MRQPLVCPLCKTPYNFDTGLGIVTYMYLGTRIFLKLRCKCTGTQWVSININKGKFLPDTQNWG